MSAGIESSQLLENVATATDPRPALAERLFTDRPWGLGVFRDEDFFDRYPQARAVRVMSLLTEFAHLRRGSNPGPVDVFLDELDATVEQAYDVTRLHFLQGSIYQMLGDFDQASSAYKRALYQRTEHYPAAYSLAYCYLALRAYGVAADLFDFTTHFEPYRDLAEYGLAQAKMQLLKYDEAIYHLRRIIHHHDDFAPAVYLLGRAHIGKGDDGGAARLLVKLRDMSPAWGELLDRSIRLTPFRPVKRTVLERATIDRID
jgi:tetratricopeptide (TPR) repeat protein